jgi:hypothetical protein
MRVRHLTVLIAAILLSFSHAATARAQPTFDESFIVVPLLGGALVQFGSAGVEIVSLATEKCLDVADSSQSSGADVNQVRCHLRPNQRWLVEPVAGSFARIRSLNSGLCLDIRIGGTNDGGLQQYTCHGRDNQLFRFERMTDASGGVRLIARHSGKCLDVPGGQAIDGGRIQQWPCHSGVNQRWLYAEPGPYRYTLVAGAIGKFDVELQAGRSYIFEMSALPASGAPELHLWSRTDGDVSHNNGPASTQRSIISYTVPAARGGPYTLLAFARPGTGDGVARLTVFDGGQELQVIERAPFGGKVVEVKPSSGTRPFTYQTAPVPGGLAGTFLAGIDSAGRILAIDDDGGPGKASRIEGVAGIARVLVASDGTSSGATTLYANDGFDDRDGDGLGYGLERALRICDLRGATALCRTVFNLRDSDRDGLVDSAEVFGLEGNPATELPRWGASPAHKDIFVEVDYTTRPPQVRMSEADAEAVQGYFLPGRAADLANPDGGGGVRVHLDLGIEPQKAANRSLFGNWGGSNVFPQGSADLASFRRPERGNTFFHAVLDAGGQGYSSDGFVFSLQGGDARNNVRTFVHELGHVLNLVHEGGSPQNNNGLNCSVVYPSIMSYAGEFSGSSPFGDVGFTAGPEFSGAMVNPTNLCEAAGLGGLPTGHLPGFGIPVQEPAIDWNRDGVIESCTRPVRARVNYYPSQGCSTLVQGDYGEQSGTGDAPLAGLAGGSPSLARLGDNLYIFYVDGTGRLRYRWGRQGTQFPQSGCPLGQGNRSPCIEWQGPADTSETGAVQSVRALATRSRLYVVYTRPGGGPIQVLVATGSAADGQLTGWQGPTPIPQSNSSEAPALGLQHQVGSRGQKIYLVVALWPDRASGRVEGAHANLVSGPTSFFKRPTEQDLTGATIATNGEPLTLAFWGKDDNRSAALNQSWLVLANPQSQLRLYRFDHMTTRWTDMTLQAFPDEQPTGPAPGRMGFAYHPLTDAAGTVFESLRGEFQVVYPVDDGNPNDQAGLGKVWISDVVDSSNPPSTSLRFRKVLSGFFGHPWYGISLADQGGFDLFADPAFPFLKGAGVFADRNIAFYAFADGVFDLDFRASSDFQVMERGICLRLHDHDADFCGPSNAFGY